MCCNLSIHPILLQASTQMTMTIDKKLSRLSVSIKRLDARNTWPFHSLTIFLNVCLIKVAPMLLIYQCHKYPDNLNTSANKHCNFRETMSPCKQQSHYWTVPALQLADWTGGSSCTGQTWSDQFLHHCTHLYTTVTTEHTAQQTHTQPFTDYFFQGHTRDIF